MSTLRKGNGFGLLGHSMVDQRKPLMLHVRPWLLSIPMSTSNRSNSISESACLRVHMRARTCVHVRMQLSILVVLKSGVAFGDVQHVDCPLTELRSHTLEMGRLFKAATQYSQRSFRARILGPALPSTTPHVAATWGP